MSAGLLPSVQSPLRRVWQNHVGAAPHGGKPGQALRGAQHRCHAEKHEGAIHLLHSNHADVPDEGEGAG